MSSTTSSILPLPLLTVVYRESDYAFCNRSRRSSRRCDGCPGRSRSRVTAAGSSGARRPSLQPTSSRRVFGVMIPSPSTALCCLQRPSSVVHRLADWAACGPGGPRHSVMNRPGVFAPIPSVLLVVTPGGVPGLLFPVSASPVGRGANRQRIGSRPGASVLHSGSPACCHGRQRQRARLSVPGRG